MVIVNLSKTKMDHKADLIINAKCDAVMELVMEHLAIKVPVFEQPTVNENQIKPDEPAKDVRKKTTLSATAKAWNNQGETTIFT